MNQLRRDPITGVWTIIVQDGKDLIELKPGSVAPPVHRQPGETCSYCQGHENETPSEIFAIRPGGSGRNEAGWKVRVVPEKFPVLQIHGEINNRAVGIYDIHDGIGAHEVVIECPEHNRSLSQLSDGEISEVLTAYRERMVDLKHDTRFRYILAHKNYRDGGDPHTRHAYGNILATPITPQRVRDELTNAQQFFAMKDRCIFCDVIRQEFDDALRIVAENDSFLAFCPFAARAPFETWILPRLHETFFETNNELPKLAALLRVVLVKIRECLGDPNYILEIHSGPNLAAGRQRGYWKTVERDFHWHLEITPRLRGYSSFEIGFGFQVNWAPPERSAELLRAVAA